MAGPLLNFNIVTRSTAHSLRAISIVTFPPAFILLLIQGIVAKRVNPAIGILPLFFSSTFSALLLANEKRCGCQYSGLAGTAIHLVFDVLLGIGLLVCLILAWVKMPERNGCGREQFGMVILGTYGTNFLLCNFFIHVYFIAQQLRDVLTPGSNVVLSCPECQYGPFNNVGVKLGPRHGYAPLLDQNNEPNNNNTEAERTNEGDSAV